MTPPLKVSLGVPELGSNMTLCTQVTPRALWGHWSPGQKRNKPTKHTQKTVVVQLIAYSRNLCNWQVYKIWHLYLPVRVMVQRTKLKSQLFLSTVFPGSPASLCVYEIILSISLKIHHQANRIVYPIPKFRDLDRSGHSASPKICFDKCKYPKGTDLTFAGSTAVNSDFGQERLEIATSWRFLSPTTCR